MYYFDTFNFFNIFVVYICTPFKFHHVCAYIIHNSQIDFDRKLHDIKIIFIRITLIFYKLVLKYIKINIKYVHYYLNSHYKKIYI